MKEDFVQCPRCAEIFQAQCARILSKRELEVAVLLARGRGIDEIMERLFISRKTVEAHRANIYHKTGTRNPAQLTLWAVRHHLVEV